MVWVRATLLMGLALAGCDDVNSEDPVLRTVGSVEVLEGDGQEGLPGYALSSPLVVQTLDRDGRPLQGVQIAWRVSSGGGSLASAVQVTNADGRASATWSLGRESRIQTVEVLAGDLPATELQATATVDGQWEAVGQLPVPVRAPAVGTDGTRIYVFGGSTGASPRVATTQVFDPSTETWTQASAAPGEHEWGTAVFVDGVFHLLGGVRDGVAASDHHWIYDPVADTWSTRPALPSPAAGSASALLDGRVLLAGGIDGPGAHSDNLHIYDASAETWSAGPPTPAKRINWQGVSLGEYFYVAGGLSPGRVTSAALYRYHPAQASWASLAPMPGPNEGFAGASWEGMYCVVGGRVAPSGGSFNTPFDDFNCFIPEMGEWLAGPAIPTAAQEMGAVSVGGDLYILGGRVTFSGVTGEVYRLARPTVASLR